MTLTKRIIPCLHVATEDGQPGVYSGVNFRDLERLGKPVELARSYNESGADELVFLDITASSEDRETMLDIVSTVAEELFIPLTVGGGVRSTEDINALLRTGADKISINTAALADPSLVDASARTFGSQCIVVAIDARRRFDWDGEHYTTADGESCWYECVVRGGTDPTGVDVVSWAAEAADRGAGELLVSSIEADGTREGYEIPLLEMVCDAVSVPVIASSGCGSPADAYEVFTRTDADAALAASIFHAGDYTVRDVKTSLADRGVPVRLDHA